MVHPPIGSCAGSHGGLLRQARLSYSELARRSSAIAQRLTIEGIGPDVVVALLAKRDVDLLAAMIAVQSVGGAFLCLARTQPPARLAQIVESSGKALPLVLAGRGVAAVLGDVLSRMPGRRSTRALLLEDIIEAACPIGMLPVRSPLSSLAYLVYTLGPRELQKAS